MDNSNTVIIGNKHDAFYTHAILIGFEFNKEISISTDINKYNRALRIIELFKPFGVEVMGKEVKELQGKKSMFQRITLKLARA